METAPKLIQFVDTPYNATYSAYGEALVYPEGAISHIISVDGYRKVYVRVNGTEKTTAFDLIMGKLSGATLGTRVADNQPADRNIHGYTVKGPEIGLVLRGTPNSKDQVKLWLYLRP